MHATGPIVVDGRLDEPAWFAADSAAGFITSQPRAGFPESERTVVRVLYDERNLYIGADLYNSEPDRLIVSGLEQDFQTYESDVFAAALDTFGDRCRSSRARDSLDAPDR